MIDIVTIDLMIDITEVTTIDRQKAAGLLKIIAISHFYAHESKQPEYGRRM